MTYLSEFFSNSVLWTAAIAWAIAQGIKILLTLITEKRFDFTRITGTGGMPSSHSAFTVALAVSIGIGEGFNSAMFAVSAAFAIVVMYDATGIRRSAGQQAVILNRIVEKIGKEDITETGKKLKELLGHTPIQVFAGAILGVAVAIVRHCI
ncbi:MAG: divergent PAP2 family protein [Clostridia bacterium]|nr:divergent PAP2 family protein [Clostridia bacterium]